MNDNFIEESAAPTVPMGVGHAAPDFSLLNEKGENWCLTDTLGNVTVLLFYPQNETLVCTRQLCSLRDNWNEYQTTKASIVGISSATPAENKSFAGKYQLPIPLLADDAGKVTKIYSRHWLLPTALTRAVTVIDAKGIIRYHKILLRAFRPDDRVILTEIYAARTNAIYETFDKIQEQFLHSKNNEN